MAAKSESHEIERVKDLSHSLTVALVEGSGMNDLLDRFLHTIAQSFSVPQLVVYDYFESEDIFEFLYFLGYPPDARSELSMRIRTLDLRRALSQQDPYWVDTSQQKLLVPLYFQADLEAVLLLESPAQSIDLNPSRVAACKVISRFLGLFMSSNRLDINQKQLSVLKSDLERAREVQMTYLPSSHPVTDNYEIYGYNQSSALIGGDYFDYFSQRENSIQCVVADACGHGMAAALIMSAFRSLLHSEVRKLQEFSALFTRLNQQLYTGGELLQYLTGIFLDYDENARELHYHNSGHFDPVLLHLDGTASQLTGGGPPLGMFRNSSYDMRRARTQPGDLLVLFTDGLVELRNPSDEFFGTERIIEAAREGRTLPLPELAREMLSRAASFANKVQPDDDVTLFLMRFR